MIESAIEEGIYYHMGIIDYLQDWNTSKNLEKNIKKLKKMNINLDTSS